MATDDILGITLLDNSQVNHNLTVNEAIENIARSANDFLEIDMSAGDVVVSLLEFQRAALLVAAGHSVAQSLTVPQSKRMFAVLNSGTGSGTLNVVRGATTIPLSVGDPPTWFYTDGTVDGLVAFA